MDAVEFGAYMALIICAYQAKNKLPDDDKRLARMAKCTPRVWRRIKPTIAEKWQIKDGFWSHIEVGKQLDKYRKLSQKNKANALKNKETGEPVGEPKDQNGTANTNNNHQSPKLLDIYIGGTLQSADSFFEIFWNAYPDVRPKGNKSKAKEKFKALFKQMTRGELCHETFIRRCAEYKTFCEQGGNYNQHAITWLNQKGWGTDWASQTSTAPDKPRAGNSQHKAAGGLDKIIDTGEKAKEMLRRQATQGG